MADVNTGQLGAGDLNQRITFQERVAGLDGVGQVSDQWQDIAATPAMWAAARPTGSSERFASGQMQSIADVVFSVRYRADITATMRILWRGEPYEIEGDPVDVNGGKYRLDIACMQGVRGGR